MCTLVSAFWVWIRYYDIEFAVRSTTYRLGIAGMTNLDGFGIWFCFSNLDSDELRHLQSHKGSFARWYEDDCRLEVQKVYRSWRGGDLPASVAYPWISRTSYSDRSMPFCDLQPKGMCPHAKARYTFVDLVVPCWFLLALSAIPTMVLFWRDRRFPAGCCQSCGYDLTGNASGCCPECGTSISVSAAEPA